MKKKLIAGAAVFALAFTGCVAEDASKVDLKEPKQRGKSVPDDYEVRVPDALTVYQNIDGHPTLNRVCIEGVAFLTTSRDFSAVERIPEWDALCKKAEPK